MLLRVTLTALIAAKALKDTVSVGFGLGTEAEEVVMSEVSWRVRRQSVRDRSASLARRDTAL